MERIAKAVMFLAPAGNAMLGKMPLEPRADRIDARLVVGPGIDVHDIAQQVDHRLFLRCQPFRDLSFVHHRLNCLYCCPYKPGLGVDLIAERSSDLREAECRTRDLRLCTAALSDREKKV